MSRIGQLHDTSIQQTVPHTCTCDVCTEIPTVGHANCTSRPMIGSESFLEAGSQVAWITHFLEIIPKLHPG